MPSISVPTAILGSAVIGGAVSTNAANKAAKASTNATNQTLALQQHQYDTTRSDLAPYTTAGTNALSTLEGRLGGSNTFGSTTDPTYSDPGNFKYGLGDYTASPAYAAQLKGGVDAINASMAHRGALDSGATLKSLTKFGNDLALQDFSNERSYAAGRADTDRTFNRNVYNDDRSYLTGRYDTTTNALTGLTNLGQSSAAGVGNAGQAYANSAGNALTSNAANQANAGLVSASQVNNLLGTGVNALAYTQRPTTASIASAYTPATQPYAPSIGAGYKPYAF